MAQAQDEDVGVKRTYGDQFTKVVCDPTEVRRTLDWRQGLAISLGVPLLILPSIGYTAKYLGSFAIILWGLSVFQGFMQNLAYGELATAFPNAPGLPGFAQQVFTNNKNLRLKYDRGQFIGGFSAWSYWFAWNPVLAIFAITAASYLQGLIPALQGFGAYEFSLICGVAIFGVLMVVNSRGLSSGATVGIILAIFSLIPLIILALAPFVTGAFHADNITNGWLPTDWTWDGEHILISLGLFAIAQWSACAWETAAIYGPVYRRPGSDVPKALFVCGIICLFTFVVVQASVTGTLGVKGVLDAPVNPLLPVAESTFGSAGAGIMVILLVAAMVLIIQTAYLGSSKAMQSMAEEGNLPRVLGRTTEKGVPILAMIVIGLFNLALISLRAPNAILAASAIGYVFANGISLFAFVKAKRDPELAKLERPFKAPKGWKCVALLLGLFNLPLCLIGVAYINCLDYGASSAMLGFIVLAIYLPLWWYSQYENRQLAKEQVWKGSDAV